MSDPSSDVLAERLPQWDLDSLFPGPESPELLAAHDEAIRLAADLATLFDRYGVGARPPMAESEAIAAFEAIVAAYDAALRMAYRLDGYLSCLTAADTRNEAARAAESRWQATRSDLAALAPRFTAWAATLDRDALGAGSAVAREHEPVLCRLAQEAAHLMPPGEEVLAAALAPSAAAAWMALADTLMSLATARIEMDGKEQELPLSEIDNLDLHPDRDVRRRGHDAGQGARRALAVPLAAALNGVKGQQLVLSRRRDWDDPLDAALFANAIDREILDTMLGAIRAALPDYRRYLRAKARLLGLPVLAGYDLMAPVGEPAPWPYDIARGFVCDTFTAFHPKLGAFAERAFAESWIDAAPRVGKVGGGFCTGVGDDASRILLNYTPAASWMSALAHELGHAYHNYVPEERQRTFLQAPPGYGPGQGTPMVLAETASTLCEILVQRAAVDAAEHPAQRIAALEAWLQSFTLSTFGILPFFVFEREVFAARAERELSPSELEELMAAAWREVAGDAIDPETVWSMLWTMGHFFGDTVWYYNFPYAFGMLFALGLLAERDTDPAGFLERFDTLLADSAMRETRELAATFGIDLADPAFWRSRLDGFRADVDRFERLAQESAPR